MTVSAKVIAITCASDGVGEATARLLAKGGAKVVVGARRADRLAPLVNEIREAGGEAEFRSLDVSDRASLKAFVDFAIDRFGRLDFLVNT